MNRPPSLGSLLSELLRIGEAIDGAYQEAAERHGLTLRQALVLRSLDLPLPMSRLADAQACDPSNVTGLIDRIERLGLLERLSDPGDRRVRLLTLTSAGREIRNRIEEEVEEMFLRRSELEGADIAVTLTAVRPLWKGSADDASAGEGKGRGDA